MNELELTPAEESEQEKQCQFLSADEYTEASLRRRAADAEGVEAQAKMAYEAALFENRE